MQRRRVPVLDSFFDRVNMLLWPRFKSIFDNNLKRWDMGVEFVVVYPHRFMRLPVSLPNAKPALDAMQLLRLAYACIEA